MLTGRRVVLRPVRPEDYAFLLDLQADPRLAYRWRFGYRSVRPERVIDALWGLFLLEVGVGQSAADEKHA
jgi:hypothetical protein